jgi:hypothetical protein
MYQELKILAPDDVRTIQAQCYGQYKAPEQDWKVGPDGNKFMIWNGLSTMQPFTVGPMSVFYTDKFAKMVEDAIIAKLKERGIDIGHIESTSADNADSGGTNYE